MTLQNGLIYRQFSYNIILWGLWYHFSYFESLLAFSKPLFLQNLNTSVETDYRNFKLNPYRNFFIDRQYWVLKDASDVSYSNGLKIPAQMVLEVDALLKHWRVNTFWRLGKLSCKIMACNSSSSPSLLFGVIFVCWFLFNSAVENFCSNIHYAAAITWLLIWTTFSVFLGRHIVFNLYTKLTEMIWI